MRVVARTVDPEGIRRRLIARTVYAGAIQMCGITATVDVEGI